MKYYQVKGDPCNWAHGELFTENEYAHMKRRPNKRYLRLVKISSHEVHFFFGIRLPDEDAQIEVISEEVE